LANKSLGRGSSGITFAAICTGQLNYHTSIGFFRNLGLPWVSDPGRIAAQIISALGFLGTGLIWVSEDFKVKGLSIAASLWLTAILGILIGAGMQKIVIIFIVVLLFIYRISEKSPPGNRPVIDDGSQRL
jgi:uncharacterized membrane protein YhiD involved in acid resistance